MSTQTLTESGPRLPPPGTGAIRRELLENEQVEVIETTYAPGEGVPRHAHAFPGVVYTVDGGVLETAGPDGALTTHDLVAGQAFWRSAQAHSTRNIGGTPVRILEVDVKQGPTRPDTWETAPPMLTSGALAWSPDPADPRIGVARLVGDPAKPGPYTVRYRIPAGYRRGLHVHPDEDEQLTVLSGSIHWSSGESGSGAPEYVLTAGAFAPASAGTPHRLWTTEECVVQMSGIGPRTYIYFDPADDPRDAKG